MKASLILLLSFIAFLFAGQGHAQEKALELKDPYTNAAVYPERVNQLQWMAHQNQFTWIEDSLMLASEPAGKANKLLTLSKVQKDFKNSGLKSPKRFPSWQWKAAEELEFISNDSVFVYHIQTGKITFQNVYPTDAEYIQKHPKTGDVAFTEGQNLFIYSKGKKTAVTNDLLPGIVNGQTVSRSEFGITHGIFWSPEGSLLAYYHKDETMVSDYPLVDVNSRVAEVKNTKYPMAGMTSEQVTVCVFNPSTGKTIELKTGKPVDQYLTNITWSPDEKSVFIAVLNRDQNHMKLNQYNAETGDFIKTLFEEKNERYVEPQNGLFFLNTNPNNFVWLSRRDGWNHAYLYNTEGELLKQLTTGPWEITEFIGFSADDAEIFFMATKDSPIENNLYNAIVKNGKIKRLTTDNGVHNVDFSFDNQYFIDIYSNHNKVVREYNVNQTNKGKVVQIIKSSKNPLADYNLGEMTISTLKANDGTDLYYRLIKPAGFDPAKKYPVIVYVYGGPHAQLVTDSWLGGGGFFLQYLATQGYVVFTLDNRGSANRGFAFESIIHRQLGKIEMQDQMTGIEFLKSLPYVDVNRIGVNGWSYGGFMTTSLMTNHNDVFKVGVAGGPVIDWKYYEVMYGERYMDRPEENPEGYEANSLLNKAGDLKGRLLIIHGAIDPTVVWQNSLQFLNTSIKAGTQVDYFVYPNHEHNVRGIDRLHLETKIFQYFEDHLK